jgi:signal transduction histidine kinase
VTLSDRARALWARSSGPLSTTAYVALGLVGTLSIALFAGLGGGGTGTASALLAGGAGGVLSLLLVRRRTWTLPLAVVAAIGCLVAFTYAAAWLALFALAVRRRDRWLVVVTFGAWAGSVVSATLLQIDPVGGVLLATPMYGFAVAGGAYVGSRRALLASLRERAERAESEQAMRSNQARLAERSRIAQEMHDVLAHKISLVTLQAGGLEVNPAAGPEEVERVAGLIRTTARQALDDLRGVLGVLRGTEGADLVGPTGPRPPLAVAEDLTPQPGLADVRALVEASRSSGVPVRLDWDVPDAPVPDQLGRTVYRVVQEALTNVHKHAHGVSAAVLVRGRPGGRIDIEVANPRPVGSSVEPLLPGTGTGLDGLAERVRLAGGQVQAGPTPDGFRVRAWLPWPLPVPGSAPPVVVPPRAPAVPVPAGRPAPARRTVPDHPDAPDADPAAQPDPPVQPVQPDPPVQEDHP